MKTVIVILAALTLIGGATSLYVFQSYTIADAPDRCTGTPLNMSDDTRGLIRFGLDNTGDVTQVTLCLFADGEKVAERSVTLAARQVTAIDLPAPVDGVTAVAEFGPEGPAAGMAGRSAKQLRLCSREAAIVNIRLVDGGIHVTSGDCFDPAKSETPGTETKTSGALERFGAVGPALASGAAFAIAGALVVLARHRLLFAFLLFTRLARPRVLDLPTRQKIHDLVAAEPGIHANAIANRLELAQGEIMYHLHVLQRERLLVRVGNWGFRSLFVAGRYSTNEMRSLAALRMPGLERIYSLILARPGLSLGRLAQEAGLSVGRISRVSRRLEEAGLVERREVRRQLVLYPKPNQAARPT